MRVQREPAVSRGLHQIKNLASSKEVWVLVLGFLMFLLAVSLGFSVVLDTKGSLRGKVEILCEDFEDNEGQCL